MSVWTKRRDRPLRVSAYLPNWTNGLRSGEQPSWAQLAETAQLLEELGVDGIWVADQMLQEFEEHDPLGFWDSWMLISALAVITQTVTLGPLVASAGFRNPAVMANMAATLSEVSGGRGVVGLGAGYDEGEHRAIGLPWGRNVTRLAEAAAILDDLLDGQASTRDGEFYSTSDARLLPGRAAPLLVGTYTPGPRTIKIVAEHADAWSSWLAFDTNSVEVLREQASSLDDACRNAGRDPATLHPIACVSVRGGDEPFRFGPFDLAEIALSGTDDQIAAQLREFAGVADEVALYTFPLSPQALDKLAGIMRALEE